MKRRILYSHGLPFSLTVRAAQAAGKPDPTGVWTWAVKPAGEKVVVTLKLKLEAEKLSGTIQNTRTKEKAIDDATFKDGELSFSVTREPKGKKVFSKYSGKLTGNMLTGTVEIQRDGKTKNFIWKAKRRKVFGSRNRIKIHEEMNEWIQGAMID